MAGPSPVAGVPSRSFRPGEMIFCQGKAARVDGESGSGAKG